MTVRLGPSQEKGFTLIETIILLLIVSILSAISIPKMINMSETMHLQAAARKLAYDIRYVRENALSLHDVFGIEFDVDANSYQAFQWEGAQKNILTDPHTRGEMVIDLDVRPEYEGVSLGTVGYTDSNSAQFVAITEFRVDAFGNPEDDLGNDLEDPVVITLQSGSESQQVQMTHQTGFVEVT